MTSRGRPRDKQRCSMIDCPSTLREKSHHFPKNENLGAKWVKATGNPDLLDLSYQQIYDNKYCICLGHFANEDHLCGVRKSLKKGTVPTLFLLEQEGDFSSRVKNDSKIHLEKIENCSAEINVTPTRNEFSPISNRNWNPRKSGNGAFWRKSSLLVSAEKENSVSGGLTATPKTEKEKLRRRIGRPSFLQVTTLHSHNSTHITQHGTTLYDHNSTPHNSTRPQLDTSQFDTSQLDTTTTLHGHNSTQTTWP